MLDDGADVRRDHVVDCVGLGDSLQQALDVVAPGGHVHAVGMPGVTTSTSPASGTERVDLRGCYAYTPEDFAAAIELVRDLDLGRLVSATYPCPATRTPSPRRRSRPPWCREGRLRPPRREGKNRF
jgi:threonine dehydrogenase-like Zn-dependent dehydrogenase